MEKFKNKDLKIDSIKNCKITDFLSINCEYQFEILTKNTIPREYLMNLMQLK